MKNCSPSFLDYRRSLAIGVFGLIATVTVPLQASTLARGYEDDYFTGTAINDLFFGVAEAQGASPTTDGTPTNAKWTGGSPDFNNWSDSRNWEDGANPSGAGQTIINFAGTTRTTSNNDYGAYTQFNQILFNSGAGAFTLTGSAIKLATNGGSVAKIQNDSVNAQTVSFNNDGNSIVFNTSGELNPVAGDLTINNKVVFDGGGVLNVYGNTGKTLTLNGILANGGVTTSLVNQNNNIVVLNNTNTYTGGTTLNGGVVSVSKAANLGSGTTNYLNFNSGTLRITGSDSFSSGTTRQVNVGATGGTIQTNSTTQSTITGAIIATNGGILIKNGTGSSNKLVLSGAADNISAAFDVQTGTLSLQKTSSSLVHAIGGNSTVASGARLELGGTGGDQIFNNASLAVNGTFDLAGLSEAINALTGGGVVTNSSGAAGAPVTSTLSVGSNNGGGTFAGSLQDGGAGKILAFVKNGNGTITLSGSGSNYTGGTTINGGVLAINSASSLGASTGASTINAGTLQATANISTTRNFLLGSASSSISVDPNMTYNITGTVNDAAGQIGALTKTGAGTLTLSGNNTYAGDTRVSAGTLTAAGTAGSKALGGTNAIAVDRAGTLLFGADDQIRSKADVALGSTAGTGSATLNTGGFSQGTGARLGALTLVGGTASVIDFATAAAGGNSILAFASSFSSTWDGTLNIYNWTGTQRQGGGTDQLFFGTGNTGLSSTQLGQINFYSDAGSTFLGTGMFAPTFTSSSTGAFMSDADPTFTGEVVPVPEPSTYLAGALALLAVGYTQRHRFARKAKCAV